MKPFLTAEWRWLAMVNYEIDARLVSEFLPRATRPLRRSGVVFIKEVVPRRAIATVARTLYNENYVSMTMRHEVSDSAHSLGSRPSSAFIADGSAVTVFRGVRL